MAQNVSLDSSPRKVRSDRKYGSNAERQRAYRNRKKSLESYFRQLDSQAEAEEFLESIDEPVEGSGQ